MNSTQWKSVASNGEEAQPGCPGLCAPLTVAEHTKEIMSSPRTRVKRTQPLSLGSQASAERSRGKGRESLIERWLPPCDLSFRSLQYTTLKRVGLRSNVSS